MKDSIKIKANAMKKFNELILPGEIVIFGSTYMSEFPLYEHINKNTFENAVYNRSIEGLTVKEALDILQECVIDLRPGKIFISLGEEDEKESNAINDYNRLISRIRSKLPECSLYLIGLNGTGAYVENFNKNIESLCDEKKVKYIKFLSKNMPETALYKVRFKQLSCFFRNNPITMSDAFIIAGV